MYRPPVVVVVDDDNDTRDALALFLRSQGYSVECFGSPLRALEHCDTQTQGCLLVDLQMRELSGLELRHQLAAKGCDLPFIVLSGCGDIAVAVEAMRQGALDFIEKPFSRQRLLNRIEEAMQLERTLRKNHEDEAAFQHRLNTLTPREFEVLQLVAEGRVSKEIARRLQISTKTVDVHRSNIMRKMHVDSVAVLLHLIAAHTIRVGQVAGPEASTGSLLYRHPAHRAATLELGAS